MKTRSLRLLLGVALAVSGLVAHAQSYPNKSVRLIVPYGPGGPSDLVARVLADEMAKSLGQPVVVDNKPGAGSMVGTEYVVRAPADGYTLLLTDLPLAIVPHVLKAAVKYDPVRDLDPVGLIGASNLGFFVPENVPAKTLAEYITWAKAKTDGVRLGSGGNGSLTHLMAEVFAQSAGFQLVHIPYLGTGPAMPDLLSGRLDGIFNSYLATQSYLPSGKVRALAMASRNRAPELPTAPTFTEAGLPAVSVDYWLAIVGPAAMPAPVTAAVRTALIKALESAGVREKFAALAITPARDVSGETLRQTLQGDFKRWGDVVRQRNITVN